MSDKSAVSGVQLGFPSLTRALYAWSFLVICVTVVLAIMLGNSSVASQVVEEINSDPLSLAALIYDLLSTVTVYSLLFNAYVFLVFLLTAISGFRLFRGSGSLMMTGAIKRGARAGSALALFGSFLSFLGYLALLAVRFKPTVSPGVRAQVVGPFVLLPVPLPWPIALGLPLWFIGIAAEGVALFFAFSTKRSSRGKLFSLLLVLGIALLIIPLIGMILALISSKKLEAISA
ncbi:MAG: hypothetical protein ACP5T2_05940 [Thermoprotei archaeon]